MNKYELLYIIDNELEAEAKDALIAKFSDIVVNDGGSEIGRASCRERV